MTENEIELEVTFSEDDADNELIDEQTAHLIFK